MAYIYFDSNYGPYGTGEEIDDSGYIYPGFEEAVKRINNFVSDIPRELYVDINFEEVVDRLPEGEEITIFKIEPDLKDFYRFNPLEYILGRELIKYL